MVYQEVTIDRHNLPPIRFSGRLIWTFKSKTNDEDGDNLVELQAWQTATQSGVVLLKRTSNEVKNNASEVYLIENINNINQEALAAIMPVKMTAKVIEAFNKAAAESLAPPRQNKRLTLDEFKRLISECDWKHEGSYDLYDTEKDAIKMPYYRDEIIGYDWDHPNANTVDIIIGQAKMVSQLDDMIIENYFDFHYQDRANSSIDKSQTADNESEHWHIEGFYLVDDNGDELDHDQQLKFFDNYVVGDFTASAYISSQDLIDVDIDDSQLSLDGDDEVITVDNDFGRPITFTGYSMAVSRSSPDSKYSNYSQRPGMWIELELYKTSYGKFVATRSEFCEWSDNNKLMVEEAVILNSTNEVIAFFGQGELAKALYKQAGIENFVWLSSFFTKSRLQAEIERLDRMDSQR